MSKNFNCAGIKNVGRANGERETLVSREIILELGQYRKVKCRSGNLNFLLNLLINWVETTSSQNFPFNSNNNQSQGGNHIDGYLWGICILTEFKRLKGFLADELAKKRQNVCNYLNFNEISTYLGVHHTIKCFQRT